MRTNEVHSFPDSIAQPDTHAAAHVVPSRPNDGIDAVSGRTMSALLAAEVFSTVVANAPLVAIDLIVEDVDGAVLLGLRTNPPAEGCWFVPGGRIRKNETLDHAFARITRDELGQSVSMKAARFVGVFEHFYDTDFNRAAGSTTHYVVLAYRLQLMQSPPQLPRSQHSCYLWLQPRQILQHPNVHLHAQAYFLN